MRRTIFVGFLMVCMALCGCANRKAEDPKPILPEDYFAYATDEFRNLALSSFYDCPEEVDLYDLFYNGVGLEIDESDRAFVEEAAKEEDSDVEGYDLTKLPVDEMDRILIEYFGIHFQDADLSSLTNQYYDEENKTYYLVHNDAQMNEIKIKDAFYGEDDLLYVVYTNSSVYDYYDNKEHLKECMVTLKKVGESYQFVSNGLKD